MYKDPKGENIFEQGSQPSFLSHMTSNDAEVMASMKAHIEQLEKRLGRYEVRGMHSSLLNCLDCAQ